MSRIDAFRRMLEQGQDTALLRFSLGREYLNADDLDSAIEHLRAAVEHDHGYSAAWRELGRALKQAGEPDAAARAWRDGIEAAERAGDKQAAKEMQVFLKRLAREQDG